MPTIEYIMHQTYTNLLEENSHRWYFVCACPRFYNWEIMYLREECNFQSTNILFHNKIIVEVAMDLFISTCI